ncbi:MAG: WD40 repeat domain-containing protein [Anaerolineae bacterium]|nr:WD40 repeat domain-containing protein [Anaerolineae bacterium]
MDNLPREKLDFIIKQYGRAVIDEPRRVEALLRDLAGQHKREIFVLVSALEEGITADLVLLGQQLPPQVLFARLARRLQDHRAFDREAALWAVESWALVLGVVEAGDLPVVDAPQPEVTAASTLVTAAPINPAAVLKALDAPSSPSPVSGHPHTSSQSAVLSGHQSKVYSVAFNARGDILASGGGDHTVRFWNVLTGLELITYRRSLGHEVWSVAFGLDDQWVASAGHGKQLVAWMWAQNGKPRSFKGHRQSITGVRFSPDGRFLAATGFDRTLRLWSLETGREFHTLRGQLDRLSSLAFSQTGNTVATASFDQTIRLWNVASGRVFRELKGHTDGVMGIAFAPDNATLASCSADMSIRLWDATAGREKGRLLGHADLIYTLAFSPDGRLLASGSRDQTIRLWDVAAGRQVWTLDGHRSEVVSVVFSPDGRLLASGSGDSTIRVWPLG